MTEPVAYRFKRNGINWVYQENEPKINWDIIEPLYTAEPLHKRVKMTQTQYKEWQQVINSIYPVNLYELFNLIFNAAEHLYCALCLQTHTKRGR